MWPSVGCWTLSAPMFLTTTRTRGQQPRSIPSELAHRLMHDRHQTWIGRFFSKPATGTITDCDKKHRLFNGNLKPLRQ